jgi:TonB family protein
MLDYGHSLVLSAALSIAAFFSINVCEPTPSAVDNLASQTAMAAARRNAHRILTVILPDCSLAAEICAEFDSRLRAKLEQTIPGVQFVISTDAVRADVQIKEGLSVAGGIELRSEVVGVKQVESADKFHVCAATHPGCLFCPPPLFPKEKKNEKIEGTTVKLLATITPEGRADDVTVVKGLDKDLDMLAIKAVQGWRFSAARRNNIPIATRMQIEVGFRAF